MKNEITFLQCNFKYAKGVIFLEDGFWKKAMMYYQTSDPWKIEPFVIARWRVKLK